MAVAERQGGEIALQNITKLHCILFHQNILSLQGKLFLEQIYATLIRRLSPTATEQSGTF